MAAKATTARAPSMHNGPRQKVHIRIRYEGRGRPGPQLMGRCDALADRLVQAEVGKIQDRAAGDGAVDIYVVTRSADRTVEKAWEIINDLGIAARATIQIDSGKAGR